MTLAPGNTTLSLTPVEQVPEVPDEQAMRLATLATIADERINTSEAKSFTEWLRITHRPDGEAQARQLLAVDKADKDIDALILSETDDPTMSPTEFMGILHTKEEENYNERYQNILETETAAALTEGALMDPVRGAVMDREELTISDDLTDEEFEKLTGMERRENLTAALVKMDSLRMKYAKDLGDMGIPETMGNLISIFMPFVDTFTQWVNGERNVETLGDALRRESDELFNSADPVAAISAFEKKLEESNLPTLLKLDALMTKSITDEEATLRTVFEVVDLFGLFKSAKALLHMGRVSRLGHVADNPQAAVDATEDLGRRAYEGPLTIDEEEELIENVVPSNGLDFINNTSGRAARILEEQAAELEAIKMTRGQDFLSEAEQNEAVNFIKSEIMSKHPRITAVDVQSVDDINRMSFRIGTGRDGLSSYTSEAAAHASAERLGIQHGFYKVVREDGVYHIDIQRDLVDADGSGASLLAGFDTPDNMYTPLFLTKYLTGNKVNINFADRLAEGGIVGVNAAARLNEIFKNSTKLITKLNKRERTSFDAVMRYTQMNNNGRWLSYDDFETFFLEKLNRRPNVNERAAYGAAIQVHRANEYILNQAVRQDVIQKGFQEIGIAGTRELKTIGKIIPAFDRKNLKNVSIYDSTNGDYFPVGTGAGQIKDKLANDDTLVLVKYLDEVPIEAAGRGADEFSSLGNQGMKAQYVLARKTAVNQTAIRSRILNHFDGPHREYKDPIFIKQSLEKEGVLVGLRTHFNVGSEQKAVQIADQYNLALMAFLRAEKAVNENAVGAATSVSEATDIIQTNTRYSSFDEFKQAIDNGEIERTFFEAWIDKGTKPLNKVEGGRHSHEYAEEAMDLDVDYLNLSETSRKYIDQGRLYFSARGQHLPTPDGELAPVLDAAEIMENSIKHIINTRAFGEYKSRHIKEWVQTFKEHLDTGGVIRPDWHHFTHGRFNPDTPTDIRRAGERIRTGLNRIVHAKSQLARDAERWKHDLMQYTLRDDANVVRKYVNKGIIRVLDSDAINSVRALTFKTFLGMMDASQILINTSLTPAVMAAFPRLGTQALSMMIPLRMATILGDSKAIDHLASVMSTIGLVVGKKPMKAKEIRWMIDDMKNSGVDIVGGSQAQLDNPFDGNVIRRNTVLGRTMDAGSKLLDVGLIPFKEAERLNQMLGFQIAWLEHFSKVSRRPTRDELGKVLNRAETISGNMKSSSRAAYQNGIASIPTQFAAHPVRVFEQILEQSGGLSKTERASFFTGIVLAYGVGGLGLDTIADEAAELIAEATGEEISPELVNNIKRGYVGKLFEGHDISRLQPLKNTIIHKILSDDDIPKSEFFGPTGGLIGDTWESISGAILVRGLLEGTLELEEVPETGLNMILEVVANLPNPSRLTKAWTMYAAGVEYSKSGKLLDSKEYTAFNIAMTALGFPPKDSKDAYDLVLEIKDIKEAMKPHVQRVLKSAQAMALSEDKDEIAAHGREIARWVRLYKAQDPHIERAFKDAIFSGMRRMSTPQTPLNFQRAYQFFGSDYVNKRVRVE
jgi:hypothetical protein